MDSHFANMENQHTFDCAPEKINSSGVEDSTLADHESLSAFADLDPNLELSLDLQELIEKSHEGQGPSDNLFPELASSEDGNKNDDLMLDVWSPNQTTQEDFIYTDLADIKPTQIKVENHPRSSCPSVSSYSVDQSELEFGEESYIQNLSSEQSSPAPSPAPRPSRATRGRPRGSTSAFKAPAPSKTTLSSSSRRRAPPKDTQEYRDRRDRNNIAVRKSREKAREKQKSTQEKLQALTTRNEELQKKVDLLTKELTVLKGLFINIGTALPKNLDALLKK